MIMKQLCTKQNVYNASVKGFYTYWQYPSTWLISELSFKISKYMRKRDNMVVVGVLNASFSFWIWLYASALLTSFIFLTYKKIFSYDFLSLVQKINSSFLLQEKDNICLQKIYPSLLVIVNVSLPIE